MLSRTCSDWIFQNNYKSLKKNQKKTNRHSRINQWTIVQNKWVILAPERVHQNSHREAGMLAHKGPCMLVPDTKPVVLSVLYSLGIVLGAPLWMPKS